MIRTLLISTTIHLVISAHLVLLHLADRHLRPALAPAHARPRRFR